MKSTQRNNRLIMPECSIHCGELTGSFLYVMAFPLSFRSEIMLLVTNQS